MAAFVELIKDGFCMLRTIATGSCSFASVQQCKRVSFQHLCLVSPQLFACFLRFMSEKHGQSVKLGRRTLSDTNPASDTLRTTITSYYTLAFLADSEICYRPGS